jgi:hypothetical protein
MAATGRAAEAGEPKDQFIQLLLGRFEVVRRDEGRGVPFDALRADEIVPRGIVLGPNESLPEAVREDARCVDPAGPAGGFQDVVRLRPV